MTQKLRISSLPLPGLLTSEPLRILADIAKPTGTAEIGQIVGLELELIYTQDGDVELPFVDTCIFKVEHGYEQRSWASLGQDNPLRPILAPSLMDLTHALREVRRDLFRQALDRLSKDPQESEVFVLGFTLSGSYLVAGDYETSLEAQSWDNADLTQDVVDQHFVLLTHANGSAHERIAKAADLAKVQEVFTRLHPIRWNALDPVCFDFAPTELAP